MNRWIHRAALAALVVTSPAPGPISSALAQRSGSSLVSDLQAQDAILLQQVESLLHGEAGTGPVKCLTPYMIELDRRGLEWPARALAREDVPQEYLTAEGHFRVVYFTTGADAVPLGDADTSGVPDYVEWVGEAMEESWAREIGQLGFEPIALAQGERYQVRLEFSTTFYGWTNYRNVTDPGGSNIVINANFPEFLRVNPGLVNDDPDGDARGALRVTCAHEFKHALQVAAGWNVTEPVYWVEVDATAMEDLVYDDVNDYYNYIRGGNSPFTAPQVSLISASYEDVTWHLFLAERYGTQFLTNFSQYRATNPYDVSRMVTWGQYAYPAVAQQMGHAWQGVWRDYGVWNVLTGARATPDVGFGEAAAYPMVPVQTIAAVPFTDTDRGLATLAHRYYVFDNSAVDGTGQRVQRGGIRLAFQGTPVGTQDAWSVAIVLQRPGRTSVFAVPTAAGAGALETEFVDVGMFDTIAIVVGNGNVESIASSQRNYTLSVEFDPSLTADGAGSFGTLKASYRGIDGQP